MNTLGKALIALLAIGTVISLVTLFAGSGPVGSENLIGQKLPDFAAPLATSDLDGDSNVYTPAQAKANDATAACAVELEGAFNSCRDLKGEAVVLFWNTSKDECVGQVDTLNELAAKNPGLNTVAVAFDNTKNSVRETTLERRWKIPVAVDRDGAAASLYSVTGCPSVFFAEDGVITGVKLGTQSAAELSEQIDRAVPVTGGGEEQ